MSRENAWEREEGKEIERQLWIRIRIRIIYIYIYNGKDAECAEGEERAEDETGEAVAEAGGTTCEE